MYNGGLKISYDNIISPIEDFFSNWIQVLQHQWKKCVNCKGNYAEK